MSTRASQHAGRAIINIIKNFNNGTHRLSKINPFIQDTLLSRAHLA